MIEGDLMHCDFKTVTTANPIRDGTNWFVYCDGDSVNFVDLWGLSVSDGNKTAIFPTAENALNLDFGRDYSAMAVQNFKNGHPVLGTIQMLDSACEIVYDLAAAYGVANLVGKGVAIFAGNQLQKVGESINSGTEYARVENISHVEKYGQNLGKDGQLFLTDAKTINSLELTTKSGLQNAEQVLGLPKGQLSNSSINVVTTVNTSELNVRLSISGNEFFISGGVTSGGAPEIVVNPMNIFTNPAITSVQSIQQVE